MEQAINILHLEDNENDSLLVKTLLHRSFKHFDYYFADNEKDFIAILESRPIDIVLSDLKLPDYSGLEAMAYVKKNYPLIPFVFVSGTMGEEAATETMIKGATDYVLKNRMERLGPAVNRALRESKLAREYRLATEALETREQQYRILVEGMNEGLTMVDCDDNITFVNGKFCEMTGYTPKELIGQKSIEFLFNDENSVFLNERNKVRATGLKETYEIQLLTKNKRLLWVRISGSPVFNEQGVFAGSIGVFENIQEAKQKEQTILLQGSALNATANAIVITDINGTIEWVNPSFTTLTGYTLPEAQGKNPSQLVKSGHHPAEFYNHLWTTILSGISWKGEMINRKKDGSLYVEEQSVTPIKNGEGKITHFVAIKSDISERKKAEKELMAAKEKAETNDRLKTAFINNISHEVRTPLNAILGFSQLITREDLSPEEKENFYSMIRSASERLINTITDYIDISLITSGTIPVSCTSFDPKELLSQLKNEFEPSCIHKNLDLTVKTKNTPAAPLFSDRDLLYKSLAHLLDNAVKFTHLGSVEIGFDSSEDCCEFFVKDTGIGIAEEALQGIFDNFFQVETSNTRGYEGSGLGLSIARGLTRTMGGDIRVESQVGQGTTFFLDLPLTPGSSRLSAPEEKKEILKSDMCQTILIAEDDDSNLFYIQTLLRKTRLVIFKAKNGKEAVDLCLTHPEISLVLMDMKMPVMDGQEATRLIKMQRPDVVIIAVTAFGMSGDEQRFLDAGCDDYLPKPIKKEEFFSKLSAHGIILPG